MTLDELCCLQCHILKKPLDNDTIIDYNETIERR